MGWCCCGQTQTDGSSFNSTPLIQHQHITLLHSHLLQFPLPKNKRSSLFHFWGTPFYFFFSSFSLLPLGLLLLSFDLKVELQRVIDMIYLLDSSVTSLHWCVFFFFFLVFLLCYLDHLESSWTCFDFSLVFFDFCSSGVYGVSQNCFFVFFFLSIFSWIFGFLRFYFRIA